MSAIETAKQYWGENLPDWIEVLANESDKSSQNKIAQKIGKSSAAISQVLKKYLSRHYCKYRSGRPSQSYGWQP